ncbi:MAG: hypothetical protein AB7H66_16955 [Hyphomonadaceae bacterium]
MFEDNPAQKERAIGLAALAAIGFGGAMAVDLLVTGGFDFGPGRTAYDREQPGAYVRMVDAAEYVSSSIPSMSWFSRPPDTSQSEERLVGADDGTAPPDMAESDSSGGDDLYRQIAALYADSEDGFREEPVYQDAPAIDAGEPYAQEDHEEPVYEDEYPSISDDKITASETESPW